MDAKDTSVNERRPNRQRVCVIGSLPRPTGGTAELCLQLARLLPSTGTDVVFVDITWHHRSKTVPAHVDFYLRGSFLARIARVVRRFPLFLSYWRQLFREYRVLLGHAGAIAKAAEMATIIHLACTGSATGVDLVHAHHARERGLAGMVVARRLGIPFVLTILGAEFTERDANVPLAVHCCNAADRVIAISLFTRDLAREAGANAQIDVIYCGVDHERFRPSGDTGRVRTKYGVVEGDLLVMYAGWYLPRKGPDVLLDALRLLKGKGVLDGVKCIMCGPDGGLGSVLRARTTDWGLERHVMIPGEVPFSELIALYTAADVFVFPTRMRTEGFGLVAAEAMACGTPVVGSRIGAIPEVVEDGVTGLLATPDDPADLADKLERLLTDDPLRARMAAAGPVRMHERFSWQRAAEETAAVYRNALDSQVSGR